jgi:hypothetical protein
MGVKFIIAIVVVLVIILAVFAKKRAGGPRSPAAMRRLWYDHVSQTRFYMVAEVNKLPNSMMALSYLLGNQLDIAKAVTRIHGGDAARLGNLLQEHIRIAATVIGLVRNNAAPDARDAGITFWRKNGAEIARYLARIGEWPLKELEKMMNDHLDLTAASVGFYVNGDYAKELANFPKIVDQAMHMADMLA